MNKALAVWVLPAYQNDELFRPESAMNRDNCLAPFAALKSELEKNGWMCHTQDYYVNSRTVPTDILFTDRPALPIEHLLGEWFEFAKAHLLIQECEVVLPRNWDLSAHESYESVFTWHPDLVSIQGRYRNVCFAQNFVLPSQNVSFDQKKLCTLIAGNKGSSHRFELYSKRVEAIRFFETQHPDEFDLYGIGWDKLQHSNLIFKALNKLPAISRRLASDFPSYRGRVNNKRETLERYRFAICFENAQNIPGYVTEKIFDCLMAGCVPIYWGAPDIETHIPKECFIDFREFSSFEALYNFISKINETRFQKYITAASEFLSSSKAEKYGSQFFARSIADKLVHS